MGSGRRQRASRSPAVSGQVLPHQIQLISLPQLDVVQRSLKVLDVRVQRLHNLATEEERLRQDTEHVLQVISENQKALLNIALVLASVQDEVPLLLLSPPLPLLLLYCYYPNIILLLKCRGEIKCLCWLKLVEFSLEESAAKQGIKNLFLRFLLFLNAVFTLLSFFLQKRVYNVFTLEGSLYPSDHILFILLNLINFKIKRVLSDEFNTAAI